MRSPFSKLHVAGKKHRTVRIAALAEIIGRAAMNDESLTRGYQYAKIS